MPTALRERNRKRLKRVMMDTRRKMYTGRLVNGVASTAGAPTNKTWVRYPANSTEETLAWGNVLRPDVPVWVQKNKQGQNEIVGGEYLEGTVKWGNALETVAAHPVINEIQPTSVGEFAILPGRVGASPSGSTYIRVQAFEHSGGRYPTTDIDVSTEYPAGDDQYGRIGVYLDPTTNTATTFAGEAVYDRADFTDADKLSVPDGMYPLGAVIVYDGNDISAANTFEDWRLHHSSKGGGAASGLPAFGAQEVVTIASGVLDISGATGRNIVVAAESGTADTVDSITGLDDGETAVFQADAGDTITFAHDSGVLNLYNGANIVLSGSDLLLLVGRGAGEVTQPVDEKGGGGGGSALVSDRKSYGSGDFSTSSTTFVVINSALDITLSTGARRCLVAWTLTVVPGTGQAQVDVEIDGSRAGGGYGLAHTGGNGINQNLSGSYLTDALSAGSHTFKLMVRVDGGSATFRADSSGSPAIFSVVELYA